MGVIAIALSKKPKGMGMGKEEEEEMESDDLSPTEEEVQAAKDFHEAETDEDRAVALKAFVKLCKY